MASGAVAASVASVRRAHAAPAPAPLRIGLVGCGGRGTGAAAQALQADPGAVLVAMGDTFADQIDAAHERLSQNPAIAARLDVPKLRRYVGFDAYKGVLDADVDVVLLATPPHFRPRHLRAAIDAGKHVFAEKPVAVDVPGALSVLAACEEARRKRLAVGSGLCFRYDHSYRECVRRIHEGAVGDLRVLQVTDFRGPIWVKHRQPGWSDMEWQVRNWNHFSWLSGDFNVEQHVHYLDIASWVMKGEYPVRAYGTGGRAWRMGPEHGNVYDHHTVTFEYASGVKLFASCRQYSDCHKDISLNAIGQSGSAVISDTAVKIAGKRKWEASGPRNDKFQTEHDELFASLRKGQPLNNGEYMAKSTIMGIMGRMATYTGRLVTWDEVMRSSEILGPPKYEWGPLAMAPVAVPGAART